MAPATITRTGPNLSDEAAASGSTTPNVSCCVAIARLNASRDHPRASVIGGRNSPNIDRVPNPITAISAHAAITSNGVCHRATPSGRRIPAAAEPMPKGEL